MNVLDPTLDRSNLSRAGFVEEAADAGGTGAGFAASTGFAAGFAASTGFGAALGTGGGVGGAGVDATGGGVSFTEGVYAE